MSSIHMSYTCEVQSLRTELSEIPIGSKLQRRKTTQKNARHHISQVCLPYFYHNGITVASEIQFIPPRQLHLSNINSFT